MAQTLAVVGGGFAGFWGAISAARVLAQAGRDDIDIVLINPAPELVMRPRLHESTPGGTSAPYLAHLQAAGVRYMQGAVQRIHRQDRCLEVADEVGVITTLAYDRLLLTAGSAVLRPPVPGLAEFAHTVDQYADAIKLDAHLHQLAQQPDCAARNTVVVIGGGFTGVEVACELPGRLHAILGSDVAVQVVLVERAAEIGPELGAGPRPVITEALDALGVLRILDASVQAVDKDGVTLADGRHIPAQTVVWTGGMCANPLTAQLESQPPCDALGRLPVSRDLRVAGLSGLSGVFAAGDVALAATDDAGNMALMSCQHAIVMGKFGGHNAAADLLGLATLPYEQPFYVTCLDLGGWGAMYSEGWERSLKMAGADAKALKIRINTEWIYPPAPERAVLLAAADPLRPLVG